MAPIDVIQSQQPGALPNSLALPVWEWILTSRYIQQTFEQLKTIQATQALRSLRGAIRMARYHERSEEHLEDIALWLEPNFQVLSKTWIS